jgi:hypothetical protein
LVGGTKERLLSLLLLLVTPARGSKLEDQALVLIY